ncbi:hypothetical protein Ptr902_00691 [Pyrenophora tritici-repentis]|nr:hypothetical protein Alg130_06167 [Pyrenophora tritici-repentis]KAI0607607.1 hypothetical protein TUN205_08154 [Pyrenophora tritici-repentis]KAI0619809.1 hypothetical protein TUN199_08207 [Pyrenophora tritici-repentis]KAI2486558.1 hypothetical protein Ptr902_00691 [Pyrenophora tritici-repentis]
MRFPLPVSVLVSLLGESSLVLGIGMGCVCMQGSGRNYKQNKGFTLACCGEQSDKTDFYDCYRMETNPPQELDGQQIRVLSMAEATSTAISDVL